MQLDFIGTGDCAGTPVYNCSCPVCTESRSNPEKRRNSSCAHITAAATNILIDAGLPDLGEWFPRDTIDLILLSHYHIDHVYGLFPMRWGCCQQPLPVYGPDYPAGCADLLKHPGILDFSSTMQPFVTRVVKDLEITPLPLNHSKPSLGYALYSDQSRLAWLCDTGGLPKDTCDFLRSWNPDIIVLDCTFPPLGETHPNHNDINTAIALHRQICSKTTYLTHISHELDLWLRTSGYALPENVYTAFDGLRISF